MKKHNITTLGDRIKAIRISKGLTMEEFANLLQANKSNVSIWESNKSKPNTKRLQEIAKLGQISVYDLLSGDSEQVIYDNLNEFVNFFTADKDMFLTYLSQLIGMLEPHVSQLPMRDKIAIIAIILSYTDIDTQKELLVMLANSIHKS